MSTPVNLREGEDGFFDAVMLGMHLFGEAKFLQGLAGHDLGGELRAAGRRWLC